MPELGLEGQRKLRSSSVLVIGVGGLGIPASVYLIAAGVGNIGIVDPDTIEMSNLHRQTIYTEADIGKSKVEVAARKLSSINPNVRITPFRTKVGPRNGLDLLSSYDIVVDCTDNFPARYLINDACVLLHKPDVYASVFRFDGQASVFYARRGPCLRCFLPKPPPPEFVQNCAVTGTLGVLPGILGCIQAAQSIILLTGKGHPLLGRLLMFNEMETSFEELRVSKNSSCLVCGSKPRIKELIDYEEFCGTAPTHERVNEIEPRELKTLLEAGKRVILLDVREPGERELCRLEGSKFIPLGDLERKAARLRLTDDIVVYCHVGERSARAVEMLRSMGFRKVRSLKGGIRAWSMEVDRNTPTY